MRVKSCFRASSARRARFAALVVVAYSYWYLTNDDRVTREGPDRVFGADSTP